MFWGFAILILVKYAPAINVFLEYYQKTSTSQVRELNGIELMLDCSPIDGKNPFISQWVIFAIRNVLKGNPENQAVVSSINKHGKMDKNLLEEVGVQIQNM